MAYTRVSAGTYQDEQGNIYRPPGGRMPSQGLLTKPPQARPRPAPTPMQRGGGMVPQQGPQGQWQQLGPAMMPPPMPPQGPMSWQRMHDQEMGLSKYGTNFNPAQNSGMGGGIQSEEAAARQRSAMAQNAALPAYGGMAGQPQGRMPMGMGQGSIGFNPNAPQNAAMPGMSYQNYLNQMQKG